MKKLDLMPQVYSPDRI